MSKLLFFAGSARKESLNKRLAILAAEMAREAGAVATSIDLSDYEMPLYNGDDESRNGLPESAIRLKQLFTEHDGFFIASPEYNSSISPLLKNTLDWVSRQHQDDETPLIAYKNKVAALGAVSPGGLGGLRGLVPLRMMLGNIGVTVVPSQLAVNFGMQAFDKDGRLADDDKMAMLTKTVNELVNTADRLTR